MKYLIAIFALVVLSACTIQPVRDLREPSVAAATQTARASAIPPLPTVEPQLLPTVTPSCVVKGNDTRDGRHLYHLPTSPNYSQVVPEQCFATEQNAIDAGYTRAGN